MKSAILGLFSLLLLAPSGWSMARQEEGLTAVVVPAKQHVLQISFDLATQYSVVLISYQESKVAGGDPFLHAWDRNQWVPVSFADFKSGEFIKITPSRTLVVGETNTAADRLVTAAESWCPDVYNLPSDTADELVNGYGQIFNFKKSRWKWYASRYGMDMKNLNQKTSWYDQGPRLKTDGQPVPREKNLTPPQVMQPVESRPAPVVTTGVPVRVKSPDRLADEASKVTVPADTLVPNVIVPNVIEPAPDQSRKFKAWTEKAVAVE
jgi:hypothetical protein